MGGLSQHLWERPLHSATARVLTEDRSWSQSGACARGGGQVGEGLMASDVGAAEGNRLLQDDRERWTSVLCAW